MIVRHGPGSLTDVWDFGKLHRIPQAEPLALNSNWQNVKIPSCCSLKLPKSHCAKHQSVQFSDSVKLFSLEVVRFCQFYECPLSTYVMTRMKSGAELAPGSRSLSGADEKMSQYICASTERVGEKSNVAAFPFPTVVTLTALIRPPETLCHILHSQPRRF